MMNVGELRKLISTLPDDALISPAWANGPPGDHDPAVVLRGFGVKAYGVGAPERLCVLVDIQYLDEFEDDDDEKETEEDEE